MKRPIRYLIFLIIISGFNAFSQSIANKERLANAQMLLKQSVSEKDSIKIADGYYLIGKINAAENNYAEAYRMFYLSLGINKKLKDYYKIGRVYLRLSEEELSQGHYYESKGLLNEAIQIFEKNNIEKGKKDAYFLAGSIYLDTQYSNIGNPNIKPKFDSALYFFKKLEILAIKEGNEDALGGIRGQLGFIYKYLKDKRSIPYLLYAIEIQKKTPKNSPLLFHQTSLASAYLIFGNLSKAKEMLEQSQRLIDKGLPFDNYALATHYQTWAEYYKATSDWQKAYHFRDFGLTYQLKVAEADRSGNASKWRIILETEKKDLELKLQKSEIENKQKLIGQQKYIIGLVTLFFVVLTILSYFLYKNYKKQKLLSQRNAVLIQEQNHRVKNNLQVISSLLNLQAKSLEDKKSKAIFNESQTRLESMILLHRQLYENDNVELINIEDLLSDIAHSVALTFGFHKIIINKGMQVKWLKTDTAIAVGLIINELIINSFKYAFVEKEPILEISSKQKGKNIEIIYKDFGQENLENVLIEKAKKTFGLKLIDMLLFQISGTSKYNYSDGSAFTISFLNA